MFNNPAEQSVIGSMMLSSECIDDVNLSDTDFYTETHRLIFKAIIRLHAKGRDIDVITIAERLESDGELEKVGGLQYLGHIARNTPSAANVKSYAGIVRDLSILRSLQTISADIHAQAESKIKPLEIAETAERKIFELMQEKDDREPVMLKEALEEALVAVEQRYSGAAIAMPTGLSDLDELLGGGFHKGSLNILAARPKAGKELTLDSKVLLSCGKFKRMGDIAMNDKVASIDGKESSVIGVFPQGIKPVYKITFSDGRSVETGLDHQWEVNYRDWDSPRVMTTNDLIDKLKCKRYQKRLFIPNHSGDFGVDKEIIVDPYLLGILLGDGGLSGDSIRLSTSYDFIKESISPYLMGTSLVSAGGIDYRLSTAAGNKNLLLSEMKNMGLMGKLSHQKFIPAKYLSASKASRIKLLCGLIDTDGTVEKNGRMTYTTTSEQMANEIQELARSLGAWCSMSSRITKYTYLGEKKDGKRSYTLTISHDDYAQFVSIPHKLNRVNVKQKRMNLNIVSIEYIGKKECRCISVSHDRELYLTNNYAVTHNTACACTMALSSARAGGSIYFASLEMPRREIANRMIAITSGWPTDSVMKDHNASDSISFAISTLSEMKIMIDDEVGLTVGKLRSRARKMQRKIGLSMIVVDYLQLMRGEGQNREQEIASISRGLKGVSKELDIPILCLAQVNRDCESRADKRPMMSDLRESGAIEQDADLIMMIYRDEVYNKNSDLKGIAEILIRANRHGPCGEVLTQFNGELTKFSDLSKEWRRPETQQKQGRGF